MKKTMKKDLNHLKEYVKLRENMPLEIKKILYKMDYKNYSLFSATIPLTPYNKNLWIPTNSKKIKIWLSSGKPKIDMISFAILKEMHQVDEDCIKISVMSDENFIQNIPYSCNKIFHYICSPSHLKRQENPEKIKVNCDFKDIEKIAGQNDMVKYLYQTYFDELSAYFNGTSIGETVKAFKVTPNLTKNHSTKEEKNKNSSSCSSSKSKATPIEMEKKNMFKNKNYDIPIIPNLFSESEKTKTTNQLFQFPSTLTTTPTTTMNHGEINENIFQKIPTDEIKNIFKKISKSQTKKLKNNFMPVYNNSTPTSDNNLYSCCTKTHHFKNTPSTYCQQQRKHQNYETPASRKAHPPIILQPIYETKKVKPPIILQPIYQKRKKAHPSLL